MVTSMINTPSVNIESSAASTSMKRCTKCKESKPADLRHYRKLAKAADGLTWWCCVCLRASQSKARNKRPEYYRAINQRAALKAQGSPVPAHIQQIIDDERRKRDEERQRAAAALLARVPPSKERALPTDHHMPDEWDVREDDVLIQHYGIDCDVSTCKLLLARLGFYRTERNLKSRIDTLGLRARGNDWRKDPDFSIEPWLRIAV